jgi:hypothetical protein
VIALVAALALHAAPFVWPRPDLVEEIDVPGTVVAQGVPVRMRVVRSRLDVQRLLETFTGAFERAGLYVPPVQRRLLAEPHVTGLDWRASISYSVILHPNPDGTTTCVLGQAQLGKKRDAGGDFAPLFPAAREVLRVEQEGARVMSYVAPASLTEVTQFYGATLERLGFKRAAEQGVFERGADRLLVLARPLDTGGVSVVVVLTR